MYKGITVPSAHVFNSLSVRADAHINRFTFNRIVVLPETDAPTEVQNAVCAVCEVLHNTRGRDGIKSENNDGYAVTYTDTEVEKLLYDAARLFHLSHSCTGG